MKLNLVILTKEEKLNRGVQEGAVKQFQKLERYLPEAAQVDVRLELITRHRRGKTHYAHVSVAIPGEPRTFHTEALAPDFRTALDRIYGKTERHLSRWHDRQIKTRHRGDRKSIVGSWLHATLSAPKRLLGSLRRKS